MRQGCNKALGKLWNRASIGNEGRIGDWVWPAPGQKSGEWLSTVQGGGHSFGIQLGHN